MSYKKLIILVFLGFNIQYHSQDIHTTQLDQHDYLYNPGMIGNYHGNSRIQLSSRSQWTNINNAFQTYNFFTDFKIGTENWNKGNLGICLAANNDNSGDGFLEKTSYNLGLSSVVKLNNQLSLSLGFLSSYSQLDINPSSIKWGSQFNGAYHNPNEPLDNPFMPSSLSYFNLASGIVFSYGKEEGYMSLYDISHFQLGVSGYNLLSSKKYNDLDLFFQSIKEFINNQKKEGRPIQVTFVGTPKNHLILSKIKHYNIENHCIFLKKIANIEVKKIQKRASLLLHFAWTDLRQKGILSGKIFEYISAQKPILSIGFDQELSELIEPYNGKMLQKKEEIIDFLENLYQNAQPIKSSSNKSSMISKQNQFMELEKIITK